MNLRLSVILYLLFFANIGAMAQQKNEIGQPVNTLYEHLVQSDEVKALTKNTFLKTRIIDLRLRHLDVTNGRLIDFTLEDAQKLEQYFLNQDKVLLCKSHYLDKELQIVSKLDKDSKDYFDPDVLIDEMKVMGFMVYDFKTRKQKVLFHGITDCDLNEYENVHKIRINKDCAECGEVELSEQLQEKF